MPCPPMADDDNSDEADEETIPLPAKKKGKGKKNIINPFELLTENADEGSGDEKDNEHVEAEKDEAAPQGEGSAGSSAKKKKKNKKKKKKGGDGKQTVPTGPVEVEDDIEASIQEVNRILGDVGVAGGDAGAQGGGEFTINMKSLLSVEYKHLNPGNEMRRMFGSRVVQAEQGRPRHRNRAPQRNGRLVQPKDNWPHVGRSGITMSLVESGDRRAGGSQCFRFEHSPQYQQVQFQFLDAVQSYNPQNIANILHEHPYHMDSLIQLSEVFRMNEDAQTAVDLIERAVYTFECAFHPMFNVATGNCRLDFRRQENRAFYLLLFKHLTAVAQRACNRTALEFCKLLLSLDPDGDPLCVLLMIDFYALRSEQYSFLVRLFEEWESFRNLSQLPNFAFSVPLALFHLGKENAGSAERADKMLQESLLMFPGLLMPLLDKCGISPDKEVSSHSYFGPSAQLSQTAALKQLVTLYVGRCHSCWKEPEVMLWLETSVKATLKLVDAKDHRVKNFAEKRKVRYQGTPRNIYRHFIVSDIKDATATLPPELTNTAVLTYDPLPPQDAIVSYTRPPRQRATADQGGNSLSLFVRSLLPNFNAQPQQADPNLAVNFDANDAAEGGAEGGEGGAMQNLELRVGALMEAMRDLLNNIRLAPAPVENGHNQDGEEEGRERGDGDEEREWD